MHIGQQITIVLSEKRLSKQSVAAAIGITGSALNYLLKRESVDVETLHKLSNAVKYNFFKHYPVEDGSTGPTTGSVEAMNKVIAGKDKEIDEMKGKISELERQLDMSKREMVMQENGFLKKINELLEKKP